MVRYIITRLVWMVLVIFLVITLLYMSMSYATTTQYVEGLPKMDVLKEIFKIYKVYLSNIIHNWDWGLSEEGEDVWDLVVRKIPITLKINLISFFVYVPTAIILGMISAVKKNRITDQIISIFTLTFSSVPPFVMGFALILFFGYQLGWLPPLYPVEPYNLTHRILGFFIPVIALSIGPIANLTRLMRGELIETFSLDYLLLAKIKGLNNRQVIFRHAFRNSIVSVMPALSFTFIGVLTWSFLLEVIYNIQGLANLFMDAMFKPFMDIHYVLIDINTTVLIGVFYTTLGLIMAFIIDILYVVVDPRIKMGHKKVKN
ncbi:MAG: ABC transporter permease [Candidatus Izemoplasmataceae bacterium]